MTRLDHAGLYKALLLAGCAGSFFLATAPAMAQDAEAATTASEDDDAGAIIVTGSRIARPELENNSPTVTVDEEFLRQSSTAAIEQQLNKLPQFVVSKSSTVSNSGGVLTAAGSDIQPNATNTPGAANVSLRGVGANRSLVLIDGRRGAASNASGVVDVSTIPNSALERVEIISGGASATYGADAVAGVTNFILKKDFQGAEFDGQISLNQQGQGFEYQLGGIVGTDFPDGRGNISLAMSVNTRETLLQRDLPFYQDLWANPNIAGNFFFVPRPGVSLFEAPFPGSVSAAFPGANPAVPNNTPSIYVNGDGSLFTASSAFGGSGFDARGGGVYLSGSPLDDALGTVWKTDARGVVSANNTLTPATVPSTRYNFLARGNYEINDWIGVFAQGMFSRSTTYTVQEPAPLQSGWDIIIPWGDATYTGLVTPPFGFGTSYQNPIAIAAGIGGIANPTFIDQYSGILACATPGNAAYNPQGCTNTEVFQQVVPDQLEAVLDGRANPNGSVVLAGFMPALRETYSTVTTYNLVAGFEGAIPDTDWTWEAFVNHSESITAARQKGFYSLERARAVFTLPNFGQGMEATGNAFGGLGGFQSGFGAGRASCESGLNLFGGYEGVTDDCLSAIGADNKNQGTTRQTIAEVNLQGGLLELPAGQLRAAVGASYRENRYELLNEGLATAGSSFLDQIYGIYPSANMESSGIDVKEIYGELLIPVLHDLPFIQELNLEVGGRMSDYSTTGTSYTFKALGDWQVTDWLRFRGGFNRAERAPNIAELLLTPQQSFASEPLGDLCSSQHGNTQSANPTSNPSGYLDAQAVCLELMARDNVGGAYLPVTDPNSYYNPAEILGRQPTNENGIGFPYQVGKGYYIDHINPNADPLKPEVADTWTVGAVINSPFDNPLLSRLNLTIDYFNITINDPIGNNGTGGVLLRCLSPLYNPLVEGVAAGATGPEGLNSAEIRARAQAAIQASTCPDVFRSPNLPSGQLYGGADTARIITTYDNDGKIKLSGIDATLSWSTDVGPGTVFASINGNYMIDFKVQPLAGTTMLDYVGTSGTGVKGLNFGSSFRFKSFASLGYSWGPANMSLQWQHSSAVEDAGDVGYLNGLPGTTPNNTTGTPAYDLFNLNGSFQATDNVSIRFGVDNLFNRKPALTGVYTGPLDTDPDGDGPLQPDGIQDVLPGGSYSFFQDTLGRRFSLGANIRF